MKHGAKTNENKVLSITGFSITKNRISHEIKQQNDVAKTYKLKLIRLIVVYIFLFSIIFMFLH